MERPGAASSLSAPPAGPDCEEAGASVAYAVAGGRAESSERRDQGQDQAALESAGLSVKALGSASPGPVPLVGED